MWIQFAVIGLGAVLGANLRFLVSSWAADRWGLDWPYGTFLINVSGALAIGVVLAFLTQRLDVSPPDGAQAHPESVRQSDIYRMEAALRERGLDVRETAGL